MNKCWLKSGADNASLMQGCYRLSIVKKITVSVKGENMRYDCKLIYEFQQHKVRFKTRHRIKQGVSKFGAQIVTRTT